MTYIYILTNCEVLAVRYRPNRHLYMSVVTYSENFVGFKKHHFLFYYLLFVVNLILIAKGWNLSDLVDYLYVYDLRRMKVGLEIKADISIG